MPNVENPDGHHILLSLAYCQGSYRMFNAKSLKDEAMKDHTNRAWKIVKYGVDSNHRLNSYILKEGDVIKFGRVRFKVKKIVIEEMQLKG